MTIPKRESRLPGHGTNSRQKERKENGTGKCKKIHKTDFTVHNSSPQENILYRQNKILSYPDFFTKQKRSFRIQSGKKNGETPAPEKTDKRTFRTNPETFAEKADNFPRKSGCLLRRKRPFFHGKFETTPLLQGILNGTSFHIH